MWYLSRGTGAVALVLLTATLALGIADVARWRSPRWPRFVIDALHGTLSLAAVVLIAAHVVTSVLDPFAPLRLTDAVIPFEGRYRPLWVGLGALAFDLLLVVLVTSLLRRRIGVRAWRAVHWAAYACWPIALLHTLGSGSDVQRGGCSPSRWHASWCSSRRSARGSRPRAGRPRGTRRRRWRARRCGRGARGMAAARAAGRRLGAPRGHARRLCSPRRAAHHRGRDRRGAALRGAVQRARRAGRCAAASRRTARALADIALQHDASPRATLDVRLGAADGRTVGSRSRAARSRSARRATPRATSARLVSLDGSTLDARLRPAHGRALRVHAVLDLGAGVQGGPVSATVSARRETVVVTASPRGPAARRGALSLEEHLGVHGALAAARRRRAIADAGRRAPGSSDAAARASRWRASSPPSQAGAAPRSSWPTASRPSR